MDQHRIGTAGQHRRHPASVSSEQPVAHGVDTAMDRVELAAFDPRVDSPAPDTATQQLPPRNQPVLRGGEIRNQPVDPRRSRT
jgi:hypothetical protein